LLRALASISFNWSSDTVPTARGSAAPIAGEASRRGAKASHEAADPAVAAVCLIESDRGIHHLAGPRIEAASAKAKPADAAPAHAEIDSRLARGRQPIGAFSAPRFVVRQS
jgi:hypothetical protein